MRAFKPRLVVPRTAAAIAHRSRELLATYANMHDHPDLDVRPVSNGRGLGMFAAREFTPGEVVVVIRGQVLPARFSSRYCMALDVPGFVLEPDMPGCFANHSCNPNALLAGFDDQTCCLIAASFIGDGAEVTYDYGYTAEVGLEQRCLCGAHNCRGYIVGEKHYPRLLKLLAKRKADAAAKRKETHDGKGTRSARRRR
jgi:hypothetical protein